MSAFFPHLLSPSKVPPSYPRGKKQLFRVQTDGFHPRGQDWPASDFLPPLKLRGNILPLKNESRASFVANWGGNCSRVLSKGARALDMARVVQCQKNIWNCTWEWYSVTIPYLAQYTVVSLETCEQTHNNMHKNTCRRLHHRKHLFGFHFCVYLETYVFTGLCGHANTFRGLMLSFREHKHPLYIEK